MALPGFEGFGAPITPGRSERLLSSGSHGMAGGQLEVQSISSLMSPASGAMLHEAAAGDTYLQSRLGGPFPFDHSAEQIRASASVAESMRDLRGSSASVLADAGASALLGPKLAGTGPGASLPMGDVDLTVMAYAQWLSDVKQQAANARYHQQAELDVMRDAMGAHTGELVEFKRHSTVVVQQLQNQVSELKNKVADISAELRNHSRLRAESELNARHKADAESFAAKVDYREDTSGGKRHDFAHEVGKFHAALGSSQEETLKKFGDVDKAMTVLHSNSTGLQQELQSQKDDWHKGQELLSKAISTLSQDFADFQKHSTNVLNKAQSDVYHLDEVSRAERERLSRVEVQLNAVHSNLQANTNELILLSSEMRAVGGQGNSPRPVAVDQRLPSGQAAEQRHLLERSPQWQPQDRLSVPGGSAVQVPAASLASSQRFSGPCQTGGVR